MRPTLLTLSFHLFAFTAYFPLAFTQEVEQVKDTNGNPISPDGKYYIYPYFSKPAGGGVRLGKTGNSECPYTVLQGFSDAVNGLAVKFTISGTSSGIILTDAIQLDIEFVEKPECAESSKWVMVENILNRNLPWVSIGGSEKYQGNVINGLFKIRKNGIAYNLVFCPTTASPGDCFDIGTSLDLPGRRLVRTQYNPFLVTFVDASANGRSIV